MKPIYAKQALEDREYWEKYNKKIFKRIDELLADIKKQPFSGLGKPEPLRFEQSGYWSRRINQEHRLIYKVVDGQVYVVQCRYHYNK